MTTGKRDTIADPNHEPLADYGKAAVMVPLIIGGAIIVALIILWRTHERNIQLSEMARIEEEARQELRGAYVEMRALRPNLALTRAERAGRLVDSLKTNLAPDYAQLKISLLLLEGESLFMKDCARHADSAEERFDRALALMPYSSGEMWQFGMLGRARARFELKKYEQAMADLDNILDRNPSFGSAYYWRSLARDALGDRDGAREDEKRARALDSWPPLRDFMQASCEWTRDILAKQSLPPGTVSTPAAGTRTRPKYALPPFLLPPVDGTLYEVEDETGK